MWPKRICAVHQGMVFAIFPEQSVSLGNTQSIWVKPAPQRNYTLVKCKVCETAPKSLVWAPTCVPKFEYAPWLACSKSHVWFSKLVARNSKRTSHNLRVCWGPEQVYRRCFAGSRPSQVLLPVSLLLGPDLVVVRSRSLRLRCSRSRLTSLAFTRRRSRSQLVASLAQVTVYQEKKGLY